MKPSTVIGELIVPVGIVAIIATMLLPLAPVLLDFLLVGNLVLAILLLVSSVYINEALKLSVLPTLLLLATLYRLALNIATTRLILGTGEAGEVIKAFGSVVVQGNIAVGFIIFLIITLVQFIVVAKGAERVAEVAARFTLDALPGKQMSIDADVRAGLINPEQAKEKREELQVESRFYGALDGAMKFVKGDSIAGIVITIVNIVGGLLLGVLAHDLEISDAFTKYTLLTVGDGLLSQIPSLLNAIAAGIVVTKVTSGEGKFLAQELISQLGQSVKVKSIVAMLCLGLSLTPGLPVIPFILVGALFAVSGLTQYNSPPQTQATPNFLPKAPALIAVEVSTALAKELSSRADLASEVDKLRQRLYDRNGIIFVRPTFSAFSSEGLIVKILVRGVCVEKLSFEKYSPDILSTILEKIFTLVENNRARFIDDIVTRRLLDHFDQESPELVSAVVPGILTQTQLTEVLKGLAAEKVSLRSFGQILQALAEFGPKFPGNGRRLLEEVRKELRAVICEEYCADNNTISGYVIDPLLDLSLMQTERDGAPFDPDLITKVADFVEQHKSESPLNLFCSSAARKLLKEGLEIRGQHVFVIAHEEIAEGISFQNKGICKLSAKEEQNLTLGLAA